MDPGWLRLEGALDQELRYELTYFTEENEKIELFARDDKGRDYVPRGMWERLRETNRISDDPPGWLPSRRLGLGPLAKSLRDYQVHAVGDVVSQLEGKYGALLDMGCGLGKTVVALDVIRRMDTPTVVQVHKTFLMDQWAERIAEFLPGAKVGFWRKDCCDTGEDHDIVIAMVQSLTSSKRVYPQLAYDSFGLVITDEVHRFAAPTWQNSIVRFPGRYRLGLTATLERIDGMQIVFFAHIGGVAHSMHNRAVTPRVYRIRLTTQVEARHYEQPWDGKANTSKLISILAKSNNRTEAMLPFLRSAVLMGRKVLILTERLTHVDAFLHRGPLMCPPDTTFSRYVGGMKKEAYKAAEAADVIVGSYQMAQEGLDIPELDTLMLVTPKVSITQSVGRILREYPGKKDPIVLDFVDWNVPVLKAYWFARRKRYVALGYLPPK